MGYIPQAALENLARYRYSCVDASPFSRLVMQPYWNLMIRFVPLSIAPNMLTLIGFAAVIANFLTVLYFCPTLDCGDAPAWVFLSCAVGLQWYSLLDNLDGRQARRTANSSPLGELFDHGCDCLAVPIGALTASGIARFGSGVTSVVQLLVMTGAFWFATWEEYHTGSLYLGVFNGPTEGIQIVAGLYLLTYFMGAGIWRWDAASALGLPEGSLFGWDLSTVTAISCAAPMVVTIVFNIKSVVDKLRAEKRSPTSALLHAGTFAIFATCTLSWFLVATDAWEAWPHLFHMAVGLCFGELTSRLILAHVTMQEFAMVQRPLYLLLATVVNCVVGEFVTAAPFLGSHTQSAAVLLVVELALFAHYFVSICTEICDFLGIFALRINHKKKAT